MQDLVFLDFGRAGSGCLQFRRLSQRGQDLFRSLLCRVQITSGIQRARHNAELVLQRVDRLLQLIENPSADFTGHQTLTLLQVYLDLAGECFLLLTRDQGGQVVGFVPIPPSCVSATPSAGEAYFTVDYESLKAINPRVILASISGFGQDGPYASRPGFDQIVQGMGGLMSVTGFPDSGPIRAGIAVADSSTGLYAAIGILVALREREQSGEGQWVHASLLHSQVEMAKLTATDCRQQIAQSIVVPDGRMLVVRRLVAGLCRQEPGTFDESRMG